jgi:hypothetical protein
LLAPSITWADACATLRPDWSLPPATALDEVIYLTATLPALLLLAGSALAIALRSQWGGLLVIVLWTIFTTYIIMGGDETSELAAQEGCIGSPALFVTLVAAICVAIVLKTRPRLASGPENGDT